jgi:hypothetical protein
MCDKLTKSFTIRYPKFQSPTRTQAFTMREHLLTETRHIGGHWSPIHASTNVAIRRRSLLLFLHTAFIQARVTNMSVLIRRLALV